MIDLLQSPIGLNVPTPTGGLGRQRQPTQAQLAQTAAQDTFLGIDEATNLLPITTVRQRSGLTPAQARDLRRSGDRATASVRDRQMTVGQFLSSYYTMSANDRAQLQQSLYNAGMYPSGYYDQQSGRQPQFGSAADQDGYKAFHNAVLISANSNKPFNEFLDEQQQQFRQQQPLLQVGGGGIDTINLEDPAKLGQIVEQAAMDTLGHGLKDNERTALAARLQEGIRQHQASAIGQKQGAQRDQFFSQIDIHNTQQAVAQHGAPKGGMDPGQIAQLAYQAGFRGDALVKATAIALAESSGRPDAQGDTTIQDSTWGPSVGLWQIRSLHKETGKGTTRDANVNFDPQTNAQHAFQVSGGGKNFGAWSTYTNGAYKQYLGVAQSAATNAAAGGTTAPSTASAPATPSDVGAGIGGAVSAGLGVATGAMNQSAGAGFGGGQAGVFIPPTTITDTNYDPVAEAIEMAKREHPLEAAATDYSKIYDIFSGMLRGVSGVASAANSQLVY